MIRGDTAVKYVVALKEYCDDMEADDGGCSEKCVFLKPADKHGYRACKLENGIGWVSLDGEGGIK